MVPLYLCEELLDALIGGMRPQLHRHLSTIFHEDIIDTAEPSFAKHPVKAIGYPLEFLLREPAILN